MSAPFTAVSDAEIAREVASLQGSAAVLPHALAQHGETPPAPVKRVADMTSAEIAAFERRHGLTHADFHS